MTPDSLLQLLSAVQRGEVSLKAAQSKLTALPFEDLGFARVDHHRALRTGLPEVIFAGGKTPEQTAAIFASMVAGEAPAVLATRANQSHFDAIAATNPGAMFNQQAGTITWQKSPAAAPRGTVAVLCAGTSDLSVAEEAAVTAELFGCSVLRLYDVGVAGLHRLLAVKDQMSPADCIIVCAGMEGALPSVVGGLVAVPVIAVPTSVGYGASFGGAAALLGMP